MNKYGNLEAVIWDMDGVLIDSWEKHYKAFQIMFSNHGWDVPEEHFTASFGMPNFETIKLVTGNKLDQSEVQQMADEKKEIFCELIQEEAEFMPGVEQWLNKFREDGIRQALATSGTWQSINVILDALQARGYFKAIISGEDGVAKPDPMIFLKAAESLEVAPENCLVIEDSPFGLTAAEAAGMKAVAVTTTHPSQNLTKAALVINDLTELKTQQVNELFE